MKILKKCPECKKYTMREKCPSCGMQTQNPHPAKFNPKDKWGEYRRRAKGI
jgi:H/ACA ribonucleoprotein complex subunit 3